MCKITPLNQCSLKNRAMREVVLKGLVLLFLIMIVGCNNAEKKLIEQGDELVLKIEKYKEEKGHLPNSIEDVGVKETMEGPLFYVRMDSVNYMVYFGTSLGESMIYYSDTKDWDYRLRGMGDQK